MDADTVMILIDGALLVIAGIMFLYLALLSALALTHRCSRIKPASRYRLFAFVVPAHNEESCIGQTIRSLLSVHYPGCWYDVIVIADNCTDRTANVARSLGATVYERTDEEQKGKGYALRWCFDQLLNLAPVYDAFVVIDADSIVNKTFLDVMNAHMENGATVVQSADVVQPQRGAWSSEITRLGFLLYNVTRPLGRSVLRLSAGLRGNGMCFSREVLQAIPWQAYSRAEDLEYSLLLLLHGHNVAFAPEAHVFATMPVNPKNAESQRARWETGRFPLVRAYASRLLAAAVRQRSFVALDAFVDLIMPPIVNLFALSLCMFAFHFFAAVVGYEIPLWLLYGWLAVLTLAMVHILVGLVAARADRDIYRALLHAPRYILWKVVLYAKLAIKGQSGAWVRTTRENDVLRTHQ